MFKKILSFLIVFFMFCPTPSFALLKSNFNKVTREIDGSSAFSMVVRDLNTSKILYKKNKDMLLNPASVLKLLTFGAALNSLGEDYNFQTAFYVSNGDLYLKLGADPTFSSSDLNTLVQEVKKQGVQFKNVYIDDAIISSEPYPKGWTSDDYLFEIAPISPYVINNLKSLVHLNLSPDKNEVRIVQNGRYRFTFVNELQILPDEENDINLHRTFGTLTEAITLKGVISKDETLEIPISNPKAAFISHLRAVFSKNKIAYRENFGFKQVPKNAKLVCEHKTPIENVAKLILFNSDNYASEILFRVGAQKYANDNNLPLNNGEKSLGTFDNGVLMFNDFYKNIEDSDKQKIFDASGLSRYNAISADFIANALLNLDDVWKFTPKAGEGTLSKRMRYYKDYLQAKTGTLKGLSSLAGKIKTQKGEEVVFAIIIQDLSRSSSALKAIEDDLMDCIFKL